nr:ASCH domain-containing protein [Rubellimicrobium aerolatum]
MAEELGLLVLHGPKRATAGLLRDFEADGTALPRPGGHLVVLGGDGRPLAVIRTVEVRVGPLSSVDEAFAWDEGEGERTRDDWLDGHRRFFRRQAEREGFAFSDDIATVFERFELVWPAGSVTGA